MGKDQSKTKNAAAVRSIDLLAATKREAAFYRKTLEQVCDDTRNTRAKRLASSALTFWDQMQKAKHQKPQLEAAQFGRNGGVVCDTAKGPCACGGWH